MGSAGPVRSVVVSESSQNRQTDVFLWSCVFRLSGFERKQESNEMKNTGLEGGSMHRESPQRCNLLERALVPVVQADEHQQDI